MIKSSWLGVLLILIVLPVGIVMVAGEDIPWFLRWGLAFSLPAGIASLLLFFGLTANFRKHIKDTAPLVRKYGKSRVLLVVRSLFTIVGILIAYTLLPNVKDMIAITRSEAPLIRVGVVAHKSGSALAGTFSQDIIFDQRYSRPDNTFHAEFFPPRFFVVGAKYEIEYLPNTHMILKARLLNAD